MNYLNLFSSLLLLLFQYIEINSQVITRQSDRAQMMYEYVIQNSNHLKVGDIRDVVFVFPKPFQNVPKVILSILTYYTNNELDQGYKLDVINTTPTQVSVQVQSLGTTIYELRIGILAVDYPNAEVISNTLQENGTKKHVLQKKIKAQTTFFTSFQGYFCTQLKFKIQSQKMDDYTIKVDANNFKCINKLDYNILVIYDDNTNFPQNLFYQFNQKIFLSMDGILFSLKQVYTSSVDTLLSDTEMAFYGLKEMEIGSMFQFGIFFSAQDELQLIKNGKFQFQCEERSYIVYESYSQVFELLYQYCDANLYGIIQNGQLTCTSDCTSINPHTFNDNSIVPNLCNECNTNCLKCQNSADNCQQCISTSYYYNNKCYDIIQDGTYCDNTNICYQCNLSKCLTCINGPDTCTSCIKDYYLLNNNCTSTQPDGSYCTYNNAKQYYDCYPCHVNCKTCSGSTFDQCSQCQNRIYYYESACTVDQPKSTACENYICSPCHFSCLDCVGINQNQCTSCIDNYTFNSPTNTCVVTLCQDGFYPDLSTNKCELCQKGCSKCTQYSVCTECAAIQDNLGNQIQYILDNKKNTCYLNCLSGQYFDEVTRDCTKCHESCVSCKEKTENDCLSCIYNAQVNQLGQCQCQEEQYGLAADFKSCIPCETFNCKQCFHSNQCDSCSSYSTFDNKNNNCVCNKGYFYSTGYKSCQTCPQKNCQACSEFGEKCTQCLSGFQITPSGTCVYCNNYKYSSDNKTCDTDCPNLCQVCSNGEKCIMYSQDDPSYVPNILCHKSCSRCSGLTQYDCLSCSSDTRQYSSLTSKCDCQAGYLENDQQDCKKIQKVEELVQNFHFYMNKYNFYVQSTFIFLNISPAITYSYQLQQLIGNISYINNKDKDANNLFSLLTKYNLNNLYSLNNQNSHSSSSNFLLQFSRFLESNLHLQEQSQSEDTQQQPKMKHSSQIIINNTNQQIKQKKEVQIYSEAHKTQTNDKVFTRNLEELDINTYPIISAKNDINIEQQPKFFHSSIIPLATTFLAIILGIIVYLYEIKTKSILKYGYIIKWNALLLIIQINSNFLIMSSLNIQFDQQDKTDLILLITFVIIYSLLLIKIFYSIYSREYQKKSFILINYFYRDDNIFSKYNYIFMEIKKISYCLIISFGANYLQYTIWSIAAIQVGDMILKKIYQPFNYKFDLYSTLSLDFIFFLIMTLFAVSLTIENKETKILIYTSIFILLILFSLINLIIIAYRLVIFIINRKQNKLNDDFSKNQFNSMFISKSTCDLNKSQISNIELVSSLVKWQQNPLHKNISSLKESMNQNKNN